MPADAWVIPLAIGERAYSSLKSDRERVSGSRDYEVQDPPRGRMAGTDRYIQDRQDRRDGEGQPGAERD